MKSDSSGLEFIIKKFNQFILYREAKMEIVLINHLFYIKTEFNVSVPFYTANGFLIWFWIN